MAQTVSNLTDVLKEAWTQDRLAKQFYDDNPFLARIEQVEASQIGEKAIVPIHHGRSGGYTSTDSAGGSLNAADEQKVEAAEYTLVYHWFQVQIEAAAIGQAAGGDSSVVVAKDLEMKGAIADTRKQCMRQIATASNGILAACDTGGASTTVELLVDSSTAYGYQALVRGWLYPGLTVDVGATNDTDSLATGSAITAVKEDASDPDITIADSITTVSGTHFVYIANPNSATAANTELNGLRSMVGSTTDALGGLDPDTAGLEFWKSPKVDTTTTVLTLDLLLDLQRSVRQKTGKFHTYNLTSLKQEQRFYSLLQSQVRFSDDVVKAGQVGSAVWNGMEIQAMPDILDQDWYCLTIEDLVRVVPKGITKPTWATDLAGETGPNGLQWASGTTAFKNAVVLPFQVGMRRRNSHAAAIGLTG
jgi:hypothetical protein